MNATSRYSLLAARQRPPGPRGDHEHAQDEEQERTEAARRLRHRSPGAAQRLCHLATLRRLARQ